MSERFRVLLDQAGEFPRGVSEPPELSRREFLKLLGASMALASAGCIEKPAEKILPYTFQPPELLPGVAEHYATSMVINGYATGLVVTSHAGRPVKVEGNPEHPASLGAAGVYEQASVLQLYDPQRAKAITQKSVARTWADFALALTGAVPAGGAGLHVLMEPTGSPLIAAQIARVRAAFPAARFHFYAPLASDAPLEGARLIFGQPLLPQYDLSAADIIVALDSDLLASGPFQLRHAREFANRRRVREPGGAMNRLYVAEAAFTPTGTAADHRLRVRTREIGSLLAALLAEAGGPGASAAVPEGWAGWVRAAAADLRAHAGRALVVTGERQPSEVHAAAYLLNAALGNLGRTLTFTEPVLVDDGVPASRLAPLAAALGSGQVQALLVLGGNPVYTAPADYDLAGTLPKVPFTAYLGLHQNETAGACQWLVPQAHYLEAWGDARARDGTVSLAQPLIAPLYDGKTPAEVLATLVGEGNLSAHQLLREEWMRAHPGAGFEALWEAALQRGFLPGTALPPVAAAPNAAALPALVGRLKSPTDADGTLEITFREDPSVHDGTFANVAWLQELPDPLSKQTWGNAALMGPATARKLELNSGEMVLLALGRRAVHVPVLVLPGHAEDAITLTLGYGRRGGEEVARGVGVNAYWLRTSEAPYAAGGARVRRLTGPGGEPLRQVLAITQMHGSMHERPLVLTATREEYLARPDFAKSQQGRSLSIYRPFTYTGQQWAMSIDLSLCTGCSACVVACQAENNVPVVGREQVIKGREMHWLRIDRYFTGSEDDAGAVVQPMLCQHCEKAPCEYVCPVNATVHSPDGLNEMVYNRCVGTRFCSNNCPYKVRRFNWFDFNAHKSETEQMAMNPDVTVRERGVMEKCTYCVQRIRRAEITARKENRAIRPGEVVTACQQTCPTRAITFGSLGDADSEVVRQRVEPRSYSVLHELGTEPRTQYLARITNPNPTLPVRTRREVERGPEGL